MVTTVDMSVIGGGIVGLAVANRLQQQFPHHSIALLEKEAAVAQHQTGHNSGVVHAGVYYQPGSLKAEFCRQGQQQTQAFCQQFNIPYQQIGKLIIASRSDELQRLQQLQQRCVANQLDFELIESDKLQQIEPNVSGLKALRIASSAITDYPAICRQLLHNFTANNGLVLLNNALLAATENSDHIQLHCSHETVKTRWLICCSGLAADRNCKLLGITPQFRIIPFRGEYYALADAKQSIVKQLIYPVPDPALPFLGIHLTPMINGSITVGPNAVLGWKREGYGRVNFSIKDSFNMLSYAGFWRLIAKHYRVGLTELYGSIVKNHYLKSVQHYCPSITLDDLIPYPAGIRAQAVNNKGELIHDFLFAESQRSLHVCNAPSPAATSAFPIADYICAKLERKISS